jgi:hypothetical protein
MGCMASARLADLLGLCIALSPCVLKAWMGPKEAIDFQFAQLSL